MSNMFEKKKYSLWEMATILQEPESSQNEAYGQFLQMLEEDNLGKLLKKLWELKKKGKPYQESWKWRVSFWFWNLLPFVAAVVIGMYSDWISTLFVISCCLLPLVLLRILAMIGWGFMFNVVDNMYKIKSRRTE